MQQLLVTFLTAIPGSCSPFDSWLQVAKVTEGGMSGSRLQMIYDKIKSARAASQQQQRQGTTAPTADAGAGAGPGRPPPPPAPLASPGGASAPSAPPLMRHKQMYHQGS